MLHWVGQKGIVHNIPFILYCTLLCIFYITINHYAENTIRKINETARTLKEDRWRYTDEKSQFMFLTKQSQLEQLAAQYRLELNTLPPCKIEWTNEHH